jgi:hypothetical protein
MRKLRTEDFEAGDAVMWDPSVDHETEKIAKKYGAGRIMTVEHTGSYFIHVNHADDEIGGWLPYRFKKVPKLLLYAKQAIEATERKSKEKHAKSSRSKSKSA